MSALRPGALPPGFARLLAQAARLAPHLLPLLRACEAGTLALVVLERASPASALRDVEARRRPVVVLVGDDDHASTGLGGWRCAGRLRQCADFATIHGTAAEAAHYAAATQDALAGFRVALIETDSRHVMEWFHLFNGRCQVTVIQPLAGGQHPASPAPEEVHR
jgi:hypothetical protein